MVALDAAYGLAEDKNGDDVDTPYPIIDRFSMGPCLSQVTATLSIPLCLPGVNNRSFYDVT